MSRNNILKFLVNFLFNKCDQLGVNLLNHINSERHATFDNKK